MAGGRRDRWSRWRSPHAPSAAEDMQVIRIGTLLISRADESSPIGEICLHLLLWAWMGRACEGGVRACHLLCATIITSNTVTRHNDLRLCLPYLCNCHGFSSETRVRAEGEWVGEDGD